jgi:hypothetical protein
MTAGAYLLLNIADDKVEQAINILQDDPCILRVDVLEGSPNAIVIIEASGQKRLTELTLRAFASIKDLIDEVRLLPVKEKYAAGVNSNRFRHEKNEDA